MISKSQQIREAFLAGDQIGALRIAARFHDRSLEIKTFKRGMNAYNHREFYLQLGQNADELIAAALALLETKFISSDRNHR